MSAASRGDQLEPSQFTAKDVVVQFYNCINDKNLKMIKELISDDCCFEDYSFIKPFHGKKEVAHFYEDLTECMGKNVKFVIQSVCQGDNLSVAISCHLEWKGKHIPFRQPVELGKVPKFCSNCKKVGHNLAECRVVKDAMAKQVQVEAMGNGEIAGQSRNQRRKDNIKNRVENAVQIESVIAEDARDAIVVGFEVNEKNVGAEIVKEVGSNSEARIGQPTNQFSPLAEMNNEEILEEHAIEGGQETHITEAVVEQHNVLMLSERIEDQTITLDSNANEENIMSVDPKGAPISASLKVIQEATAIKARLVELESNRQAIVKAGETKKSPTKGKKIQNKEVYKDLGPPTTRSKAKHARAIIESPIKPGSLVLTTLKVVSYLFDEFPGVAEKFLQKPHTILQFLQKIYSIFLEPFIHPVLECYINFGKFVARILAYMINILIHISRLFLK